jgi:hypothetical protein
LLVRLEPGIYTTIMSDTGSTPGIGLVELYETNRE